MAIQNIALLAQTPEFDPLVPAQRQAQIQALADQQQQRQLAIQQARQNADEYAGVRSVYANNSANPEARLSGLAKVSPRAYAAELKQQTETAKAAAETRVKQIQAAKDRYAVMGQGAKYVADNPTLENATRLIQNWQNDGLLTSDQAAGYLQQVQSKPESIRGLAMEAYQSSIDAEKQLPKIETLNTGGQEITRRINPVTGQIETVGTIQRTSSPESVASIASQAADRAQRERIANADRSSRERVASATNAAGKAPAGYRWNAAGTELEVIPGGPAANKEPTEGERKAATLLTRLRGSQEQMATVLGLDPSAATPNALAQALRTVGAETLANTATGETRQQVEAAQLDMLDAALTLGTGAAYTKEQLEGYRRSYFPQIGDKPANIKDKADRLQKVLQAAEIAAGRAAKSVPPSGAAGREANVPARNAKGWALHTDAQGNRAYVSPDGTQFEEVK